MQVHAHTHMQHTYTPPRDTKMMARLATGVVLDKTTGKGCNAAFKDGRVNQCLRS